MAKLVFGIPHRDVVRELKQRGCVLVREGSSREIWKTPKGNSISIAARKEISSADAMRMNQALGAEGIQEIRANENKPKQITRIYEPPPKSAPVVEQVAAPEPKKPAEPITLRSIFYRRLLRAKRRHQTQTG